MISDIHNHQNKLTIPSGDLLIVAGDMTDTGTYEELEAFSKFLSNQKSKFEKIIVVAGNHEVTFDKEFYEQHGTKYFHKEALDTDKARSILTDNPDIVYLEDSGTEYKGVKIWGSPWIPPMGRWAFTQRSPEFANMKFDLIPKDIDILITHAPPRGIMDKVAYYGTDVDPVTNEKKRTIIYEDSGCHLLRDRLIVVQPKLHVFGHIHECSGWLFDKEKQLMYVNAAILDSKHEPTNVPKMLLMDF